MVSLQHFPTSWQDAWNNSQPSLGAIRDSVSLFPHPKSRILRVSQLDAEALDNELVQLLQDPINKALATVNVGMHLLRTPTHSSDFVFTVVSEIAFRPGVGSNHSTHSV